MVLFAHIVLAETTKNPKEDLGRLKEEVAKLKESIEKLQKEVEKPKVAEQAQNTPAGDVLQADPTKPKEIAFQKGNAKIKISGSTNFELAFANQDAADPEKEGFKPHPNIADAKIKFEGSVTTNPDTEFRFVTRLAPFMGNENLVDRCYIDAKTKYGKLELGNNKSPYYELCRLGQDLAVTAWTDGGLEHAIGTPVGMADWVAAPGDTDTATHIAYYSPEFRGFQFAVAFTPDTSHRGRGSRNDVDPASVKGNKLTGNSDMWFQKDAKPYSKNNIMGVLSYKYCHPNEWRFRVAAFYIYDDARMKKLENDVDVKLNKTHVWGGGIQLGYKNFDIGADYYNAGKSRLPVDDANAEAAEMYVKGTAHAPLTLSGTHEGHAGQVFNLVGKYKFNDAHEMSIGWCHGVTKWNKEEKTTCDVYGIMFSKKLNHYISVYAEADYVDAKISDSTKERLTELKEQDGLDVNTNNNKGYYFLIGIRAAI